ncbi:DNA sulfur modification protein DndD [Kurthia zopfii]|uniref:DNA sulfur modification protein DndD n=1 Tax=Kurthia zopfii TaxID=1650 RepID=UPI000F6B8B9D|nr:DNA sulfur modification protein DndD [Kurthia zopfii]VEI08061.1 recombination protein F [Kurthia zopfii]
MILHDITLLNIGAYRGYNDFDLNTTTEKPVILIGGQNGAGKTTFLNAIKLGIFGAYSLGYKTENAEYFNYVHSTLNHTALKTKDHNFGIKIHFSLTEAFKTTEYLLHRKWTFNKDQKLKETVYLTGNGKLFSDSEIDLFFGKLKENMPPQILDLCLFDGEEISRIIIENNLSTHIEKVSKVAFNLELFETLEADLNKYSKQVIDQSSLKKEEKALIDIQEQLLVKRENLNESSNRLTHLQNEHLIVSDEINAAKKTFTNFGGIVKTEHEDMLKQINQLDHTRARRKEEIKNFVATLLPFYLAKDLLVETRNQLSSENDSLLYNKLNSALSDEALSKLTKELNLTDSDFLKKQILKTIEPTSLSNDLHNASFSETSLVENVFLEITKENKLTANAELLEANRQDKAVIRTLKDKIKVHDQNTEFNTIINDIESLTTKLQSITSEIEILQAQISTITNELQTLVDKENNVKNALRNINKFENSFAHSQAIIEMSTKFREIQMSKKMQTVQVKSLAMLNQIFRKEDYISSIIINPTTFEVRIKNNRDEDIELKTISAGEKEILLISIIWAIFEVSNKKVPFIFDTLLGRLDKHHKESLLKTFIPNSGTQAIVLSTDSEIDESHYDLLVPHLSHSYKLMFDTQTSETTVHEGYFEF